MSNHTSNDNSPEATAEGTCGCSLDSKKEESCSCGCDSKPCCALCPGEKTLAFWILRVWLGCRAIFTGLSKFQEEIVGDQGAKVATANFLKQNYGSEIANKAAESANISSLAKNAASQAAQSVGSPRNDVFTSAYNAATSVLSKASEEATKVASAAAKEKVDALQKLAGEQANVTLATLPEIDEPVRMQIVHHGLPQSGDWTLAEFTKLDLWYMPEWALQIFESYLGYVLIGLGATLLLGLFTRLSLFLQGLLYTGLTLGFIAISKEPGSSAGITMLGVHIALVVVALLLVKYNKLAIWKKF
ncbi:MAG: hypothetical protein LBS59_07230 [Puniceicoccales bacterium]|nr:hypothetical protein [Puniceicoccales bacterium]